MQNQSENKLTAILVGVTIGIVVLVLCVLLMLFLIFGLGAKIPVSPERSLVPPAVTLFAAPEQLATFAVSTAPLPTATVAPSPTMVISPVPTSVEPTAVVLPTAMEIPDHYEVQAGDNVWLIAQKFGLPPAAILAVNPQLVENPNLIQPGQPIIMPKDDGVVAVAAPTMVADVDVVGVTAAATVVVVADPTAAVAITTPAGDGAPSWAASELSTTGNLTANYPEMVENERVHLFYQPNTYTSRSPESLLAKIDTIWATIQQQLGGEVSESIDVYLAGTLFRTTPTLMGLTESANFRSFVLVDGAYSAGEIDYIIAHELTHIASTHIFGYRSSAMLHEGLATYLPQAYLTQAGYLSHRQVCAAILPSDAFNSATELLAMGYSGNGFRGHIRSFVNYNLSACFIDFLQERYGWSNLAVVYRTGDYLAVYGLSIEQLDRDWQNWLATIPAPILDTNEFLRLQSDIASAFEGYLTTPIHKNWAAYQVLVKARTTLNQGDLATAATLLADYQAQMR